MNSAQIISGFSGNDQKNGQTRSPWSGLLDVTGEQIRYLITFSIFFVFFFVTFHGIVIPSKVNNKEDVAYRIKNMHLILLESFFSSTKPSLRII